MQIISQWVFSQHQKTSSNNVGEKLQGSYHVDFEPVCIFNVCFWGWDCHFIFLPKVLGSPYFAFTHKEICKESFNIWICLTFYSNQFFIQLTPDSNDLTQFTLDHLQGIFYIYGMMIVVCILSFIIETCCLVSSKNDY